MPKTMNESPKIEFTLIRPRYYQITRGKDILGEIAPTKDENTGVISYVVIDHEMDKLATKTCESINQAKAFAEVHFGKEVQP